LSSVVAAVEAVVEDAQFFVTSFDGFSVFTTADDVSRPETNDASAVNKQVHVRIKDNNKCVNIYVIITKALRLAVGLPAN